MNYLYSISKKRNIGNIMLFYSLLYFEWLAVAIFSPLIMIYCLALTGVFPWYMLAISGCLLLFSMGMLLFVSCSGLIGKAASNGFIKVALHGGDQMTAHILTESIKNHSCYKSGWALSRLQIVKLYKQAKNEVYYQQHQRPKNENAILSQSQLLNEYCE